MPKLSAKRRRVQERTFWGFARRLVGGSRFDRLLVRLHEVGEAGRSRKETIMGTESQIDTIAAIPGDAKNYQNSEENISLNCWQFVDFWGIC